MSKKIIKILFMFLVVTFIFKFNDVFAINSEVSLLSNYDSELLVAADDNSEDMGNEGTSGNGIFDMSKPGEFFDNVMSSDGGSFSKIAEVFKDLILKDFMKIIKEVGNLIFFIVGISLGIKYIFSTASGKTEVKNSLTTYFVAFFMFYLSTNIYTFIENIFNEFNEKGDIYGSLGVIWATFTVVANTLAIVGVIFVGLKYMFSPAEQKGKVKKDLRTVVIGLLLIFCISNILQFVYKIGGKIFTENNYSEYVK